VWPVVVVLVSPSRGQSLGRSHVFKHLGIEQLAAQPTVEAFGIAVLPWTPWLDVQRFHARSLQELADRASDELRPVVAADVLGHTANGKQVDEHVQHVVGGHPSIDLQGHALARELIHDRKTLDRATAGRPIEHEVPGPDVILMLGGTPHASARTRA
jgi:hypothetical protein